MKIWAGLCVLSLADETTGGTKLILLIIKNFYTRMPEQNIHLDHCDLQKLMKPKFAENWSCDKPIENNKVLRNTKCKVVCPDGFDIKKCKNLDPIFRVSVRKSFG